MLLPTLLRFLFPWVCCVCRKVLPHIEDHGFCANCWLRLPRIQGPVCRFCGIPLPEGGGRCFDCRDKVLRPPLLIRAAGLYEGGLRAAVLRLKFNGRKTLSDSLSVLLAWAWRHYPELQRADGLVPIPSDPLRLKERGFNAPQRLAEALGSLTGLPVFPVLKRLENRKPQTSLRRFERQQNVRGAFCADPAQGYLLLIDDVCTTGATLGECGRLLRRAGASRVGALVLARDLVSN